MGDSPHRAEAPTGRQKRPAGCDETTIWDGTIVAQSALVVRNGWELQGRVLGIRPR